MYNLDKFSKRELSEIYTNLNGWQWDERLGDKPKDFDEMPNRCRASVFSKYHVITPIMREIIARTSEYSRAKAWHQCHLGRNIFQFYRYWIFRRWCGLRRI